MRPILTLILPVLFLVGSCRNYTEKPLQRQGRSREEMADVNRYLIGKDRERIVNYIERKGLDMKESPTGLWYMVTVEGSGELFRDGDRVRFGYDCSLLDGTQCYSSAQSGPREIIIAGSQAEQGLTEGLKYLRPGASATFIIPPYLAFGLIGDGKKIPSRAILVYNVTILQP